jgi:hypothetical protein
MLPASMYKIILLLYIARCRKDEICLLELLAKVAGNTNARKKFTTTLTCQKYDSNCRRTSYHA